MVNQAERFNTDHSNQGKQFNPEDSKITWIGDRWCCDSDPEGATEGSEPSKNKNQNQIVAQSRRTHDGNNHEVIVSQVGKNNSYNIKYIIEDRGAPLRSRLDSFYVEGSRLPFYFDGPEDTHRIRIDFPNDGKS
ncbi:uncharacterized protein I206_105276 [Kwoniella pini CBS 10737]|uniref:Uncharacterized protein n=1 Tax=Kwoniella pini CBS 10737 TaxID=1296096 RepID=A0A1B9I4S1_9TREE|nr:uncharacterized protein I206_03815 [Kwoniella pini CBS 10737]OCF50491.1 hypothetical protein I206_03815 [Kwoniella pini CBS 10737]